MEFFGKLTKSQAQNVNSLTLAYVGDAVQSLYVREKLAKEHDLKAGQLHKMASEIVNAHTQAMQAEKLLQTLTEEEKSVYLRGRNCNAHHKAKNQSGADYRKATGLEAVLGYLYLCGEIERIKQLLELQ